MSVRVVTDSTADIPKPLVEALGISVAPLTVHFGEEVYHDGVDLDAAAFLQKLAASPALPRTAQPPPVAFTQVYQELARQGAQIVSIHISAKLSGTINSALLAKEELGQKAQIAVVDSQWTSMALGVVVLKAARAAQQGASWEAVIQVAEGTIPKTRLLLFCDTLEYLQKGGRIGRATAFLGSLLSVKPMITLQEGVVHPVERVRTRSRALERLWEWGQAAPSVEEFCVLHSGSIDDAQALHNRLVERFPKALAHLAQVGPVIATHIGPGAVGLVILT